MRSRWGPRAGLIPRSCRSRDRTNQAPYGRGRQYKRLLISEFESPSPVAGVGERDERMIRGNGCVCCEPMESVDPAQQDRSARAVGNVVEFALREGGFPVKFGALAVGSRPFVARPGANYPWASVTPALHGCCGGVTLRLPRGRRVDADCAMSSAKSLCISSLTICRDETLWWLCWARGLLQRRLFVCANGAAPGTVLNARRRSFE